MHSYRSLMVVACMGGVLVLMAGVLLYTGDVTSPEAKEAEAKGPSNGSNFSRIDYGGSSSQAAPDKGLFKKDLEVIRRFMKPGENSFTNSNPAVKRAIIHGQAVVAVSDFDLLQAELSQKKVSASYKGILIVFLGASKAEAGVPILESLYREHPTRVIEALRLNSTPTALAAYTRLYDQSKNAQERFCFIQSLKKLPLAYAQSFVQIRLNGEEDAASLKDTINVTRFIPSEKIAFALHDFIKAEDERSRPLQGLVCNVLSAQAPFGGADALIELHLDKTNSPGLRKSAGNAIAFMKSPSSVQGVLPRMAESNDVSSSLGRFLFRNSRPEDLPAIETFMKSEAGDKWRNSLKATVDRLRPQ